MKKAIIIIVILLAVGGLAAALFLRPANQAPDSTTQQTQDAEEVEASPEDTGPAEPTGPTGNIGELADGRFTDYSEDRVAESGYRETILFFYAPWCPECRAFETALNDTNFPDGVQILKVDYDSEQALKQKYAITIQSTFVKVSTDGTQLSKWVGYERDKSLGAILGNT
jgi:thiol-disulfide isomerase/thioredoxin